MPSRVLLMTPCPAKVVALPKAPAALVAFSTFVFISAGLGPGLFGGDSDHSRVKVCAKIVAKMMDGPAVLSKGKFCVCLGRKYGRKKRERSRWRVVLPVGRIFRQSSL